VFQAPAALRGLVAVRGRAIPAAALLLLLHCQLVGSALTMRLMRRFVADTCNLSGRNGQRELQVGFDMQTGELLGYNLPLCAIIRV
jgi:hypothetical protein